MPAQCQAVHQPSGQGFTLALQGTDAHELAAYKVQKALGLLEAFDGIYDVSTVRMSIFQSRRDDASTFEMSKADLVFWAETVLAPTAKMAFNGEGEFKAGDH